MMLKIETDPSEILNELIYSCRKVPPADFVLTIVLQVSCVMRTYAFV